MVLIAFLCNQIPTELSPDFLLRLRRTMLRLATIHVFPDRFLRWFDRIDHGSLHLEQQLEKFHPASALA